MARLLVWFSIPVFLLALLVWTLIARQSHRTAISGENWQERWLMFEALAERSQSLISAIKCFEAARGRPPNDLD
jgi:hypothetical protein